MGAYLAMIVYGSISIVVGYFISLERAGLYRWIFIGWLALIVPNFVIGTPILGLFVTALILLLLPKKTRIERAVLYIGLFSAVPDSMNFLVPFPGINYLIGLDYAKIAFFVLLFPILLSGRAPGGKGVDQTVATQLALFVLLTSALSFRDLPFTSALRAGVDMILLVLPALAISLAVRSEQDFDQLLRALLALAAIYAGVAIITQLIRWNIYAPFSFHDSRWGILRTGVTTVPALAGLIGFTGWIIAAARSAEGAYPKKWLTVFQAAMILLMLFTFARGAWVAGLAGWATYVLLTSRASNASAVMLAGVGALGGFIAGTTTLLSLDAYGTFSYRAELLKAAQKQFWEAPFFGSPNFLESGNFDHLWTGMGLIDVVNTFVQLAMQYGAVGLILYFAPFIMVMIVLLQYRVPGTKRASVTQQRINRLVALQWALLTAYAVLLMTISSVSFISHFGYLLLGVSMAAVKVAKVLVAQSQSAAGPTLTASDPRLSRQY